MSLPWFRFYSEFADDPKVQALPEQHQRRLVMIFCLQCKGVLGTSQERHIAFHLRISDVELAESKAIFIENGFVDEDWNVLNWNKRQFPSDSSTSRTRRYRERIRTSQERHSDGDETKRDGLDKIRVDKKKPSRDKREADVRFTPFRQAIASFWVSKNMNEMPWGVSDAAQLSRMLKENPKLTEESFRQMLQNRFNSQCNPSQRVHAWIGRITDFGAGPLDRFKQPVNYKPTPSTARPISILDEIRRTRGIEHAAN